MTTLTIEPYPLPRIQIELVLDAVKKRFNSLSLLDRVHNSESSKLDILALEQGIDEPTDLNAIWGCLEGSMDDEFMQALRQQREQH